MEVNISFSVHQDSVFDIKEPNCLHLVNKNIEVKYNNPDILAISEKLYTVLSVLNEKPYI